MAGAKKYDQLCPVATSLDIIGSQWALLVVRELVLGPRRFSDILRGLETASTDMVTIRLRELEATGILERIEGPRYQLTENGHALAPVLRALSTWSRTQGKPELGSNLPHDLERRLMGSLALKARTTDYTDLSDVFRLQCRNLVAVATPHGPNYTITATDPSEPEVATDGTATFELIGLAKLALGKSTVAELDELDQLGVTGNTARLLQPLEGV